MLWTVFFAVQKGLVLVLGCNGYSGCTSATQSLNLLHKLRESINLTFLTNIYINANNITINIGGISNGTIDI